MRACRIPFRSVECGTVRPRVDLGWGGWKEPPMPAPTVRLYRPEDRDAVYDICIRTADAGGDARGLYRDPDLLPDMFAGPYTVLEPNLAFVLDDGGRAVGYVVGTSDTPRFARDFREKWLPT